jgi:hypothetical protein
MLFIEFQTNINDGINILKYRTINDDSWYYLYIDIETLNLLIHNFGIISTYKFPTIYTNCDNPSTSRTINLKYCGADIKMCCNNKTPFSIPLIEQNCQFDLLDQAILDDFVNVSRRNKK